ncbi:MAG: outer membrane protein transport protein [Gammaproteobacteria bacterium]|nr:outer membrane protein transport protein [Gammaproteobacteria bacterium]MBU1415760.1 outer membrane protein transport protein [Gammaproteobacteria bacterium]
MTLKKIAALLSIAGIASPAFATNGMNMEGYGPIASGMGGASMAYDNGTAAVVNNPATLGMMATGTSRLDLAIGGLHPDVTAKMTGMPDAKSGGDAYYMPALGYARKDGKLTYGVALFSQGGMGTEYADGSFMSAGSPGATRSELGVGRLIAPLAFEVTPDLIIGGSLDFVWATLDLKMAADTATLGGLVTAGSGNLYSALPGLMGMNWARIDFSDDNDFSGAAKGYGWAGNIGFTYRISPMVTIGGSYHSKTALSDLETGTSGASMTAGMYGSTTPGFADSGKILVRDFQWPETYGFGVSVQATPQLQVVADVKQIGWSKVMKNFKMTYESGGVGGSVDFTLPQEWKDQTVFQLGATYMVSPQFALRAGYNVSRNPIPDTYLNALFPAIVKDHYTFGFGYAVSNTADVNGSFTYAPKVTQTGGSGITSEHSQTNWQLMYSQRF